MNSIQPVMTHAQICAVEECAPGIFFFAITAPDIAHRAMPGQFIMVHVPGGGTDPLLPRPFSICGTEGSLLYLLIKVKGIGTQRISNLQEGQFLHIIGPLGNYFVLPDRNTNAILVAGGIGIAPLLFLGTYLQQHSSPNKFKLLYGIPSAKEASVLERFSHLLCYCDIATEDGTTGFHGTVVDLLDTHIRKIAFSQTKDLFIYACGPRPMLTALAAITQNYHITCQASFETKMACGVGACMGCVISDRNGVYKRICADGPVFPLDDMVQGVGFLK
ncbi:MAG: dihydroorotate dehydrogenase electron transfer subunit [Desulfobacterota bacterium]|nr:dihydroorotate dehydrogenase electron transfer subunit [Thermodesulfobacteriota bacterium]